MQHWTGLKPIKIINFVKCLFMTTHWRHHSRYHRCPFPVIGETREVSPVQNHSESVVRNGMKWYSNSTAMQQEPIDWSYLPFFWGLNFRKILTKYGLKNGTFTDLPCLGSWNSQQPAQWFGFLGGSSPFLRWKCCAATSAKIHIHQVQGVEYGNIMERYGLHGDMI